MKKILPALSLALATSGAQADPVDEMPYMKAWAYALAIEDYCFGDKPDKRLRGLRDAAIRQAFVADLDMRKAHDAAAKHLMTDQSACGPAADFVERTFEALPDAELDRLVAERQADALKLKVAKGAEKKGERLADEFDREAVETAPSESGPWIGLKALLARLEARMWPDEKK